jgi:hypothetical protein
MNVITNLHRWIAAQVAHDAPPIIPIQNMLFRLCLELYEGNRLVSFAHRSLLIWPRCTPGENLDTLPDDPKDLVLDCLAGTGLAQHEKKRLQQELKERGILSFEKYPIHPERFAFAFAGGQQSESCRFHHLYEGRFPFEKRKTTLEARKHGFHFTQVAGMVTIHPLVQELFEHYACISHTLRARSFAKFGYDPDRYFSKEEHDPFGFVIRDPLDEDDSLAFPRVPPPPPSRPTFQQNIRERVAAMHTPPGQCALNRDE